MAVRRILQLGNPSLWEESTGVAQVESENVIDTIRDLEDTLEDFKQRFGRGRGIAAPQIGVPKRIIFVRLPDGSFDGPLINPEVVWGGKERVDIWDDCMSFPELMVRVLRAADIRIEYLDARGSRHELEASGDLSELLQHEIDHLDGILAVERAVGPGAFATRTEWESRHKESG